MRNWFLAAGVVALLCGSMAEAGPFRDRLKARMGERQTEGRRWENREGRAVPGGREYAYGSDPLQKLDFWAGAVRDAPLVIFVHGGGWKRGDKRNATGTDKVMHYTGLGYAFASLNYRLVPAARVEDQAADVANAIAWLKANASRLGFDGRRIVLMGHSAGAHLSALVGTDPRYLRAAGLDLDDLDGVIPLDGAAYDVARQIKDGGNFMHDTYVQAFGSDQDRQQDLSPMFHTAAPNAPAFLILHVQRKDGTGQSRALGRALERAGADAEVKGFEGRGLKGHAEINRKMGDPTYPATAVDDRWLEGVFRR
jgi:acetyl esterase/lipase